MVPLRTPRESGQVAVLALLFMAVLLGMCAAVLDVGSWYRADRALQRNVDAAALAGAQALPDDPTLAQSLASQYAAKNGGGSNSVALSTTLLADDTIKVTGTRTEQSFFTKIFGIDSVDVHASAKARSGTLSSARYSAPFGIDEKHPMLQCAPSPCFGQATDLDLVKTGPGAFRIINIDGSHGGTGPGTLADWILNGYSGYMPLGWYYSDPGAKFNSSQVKNALDARLNSVLLFPVYRGARGNGAGFEYEVVGWAGYVVTSYQIQGSKNNKLFGYFLSVTWEGIVSEAGGNPNFGAHGVTLVE